MKHYALFRSAWIIFAVSACFLAPVVHTIAQSNNYVMPKYPRVKNLENITFWRGTGLTFARSPMPYSYSFKNPVYSDMLCDSVWQSGTGCIRTLGNEPSQRYLTSVFGPRMTVSDPDITRHYDFHQGADLINKTQSNTDNNLPDIKCMCVGVVDGIDLTDNDAKGIWVKIKCNETFDGLGTESWGNMYMNYRHLSAVNPALTTGAAVKKGDLIGKMGNTGSESTKNHLHWSLQYKASGSYYNVHPMRAFNPEKNPHIIRTLDNSEIEIYFLNINTWQQDGHVVFRVAVPYYQANLQLISLKLGSSEPRTFDIEKRSIFAHDDSTVLDDNTFDDLEVFVYPFTRASSAYYFYNKYKDKFNTEHTGKKYPIPDSGVFQKSAYVLDIKTSTAGLQTDIKANGITIYVSDIWARGVKGVLAGDKI